MQKIITIDHRRLRCEAYVENDNDSHDTTIYICNSLRYWAKQEAKHDWIAIMTSVLSHESLHNAILLVENDSASIALDNRFNRGTEYERDYNGLCEFDKYFKPTPKSRRIKNW